MSEQQSLLRTMNENRRILSDFQIPFLNISNFIKQINHVTRLAERSDLCALVHNQNNEDPWRYDEYTKELYNNHPRWPL